MTYKRADLSFIPGKYKANADGYGGQIEVSVSFSENAITDIEVLNHKETAHLGDVAFPILIPDIIRANGLGVDAVSGATISSAGLKSAVLNAARKAEVSDINAFVHNSFKAEPAEAITDTWDVVIIGGGGSGLCAAAQAAQDGNTVLVIEKNAELGGNTLIAGGAYQAIDHNLVWNPNNPMATSAIGFDGKRHNKVKATEGCVDILKIIEGWNESPFDESYYKEHEFIIGDTKDLAKRGVHKEYLSTLKELKQEIRAYLKYAEPQLNSGVAENQLTLFSSTNLHIFQTYYGGLRQNADKSEWAYGDYELVKQIVEEGEKLKPWLMGMGVEFINNQSVIIGALWYRCDKMKGCTTDYDGDGIPEFYEGNWGSYIMAPASVALNANSHNRILTRTSANDIIMQDGRAIGVKASMDDGTELTAYARKGVIIATGGYAANIQKVIETNKYWSAQHLLPGIGTTNRTSLRGDGIAMAQAVGAATVGEGFTQLMPMSYALDGRSAFANIENAVFISPDTGKRFVDECAERDFLTLELFRNGAEMNGVKGVSLFFTSNDSRSNTLFSGFGTGQVGTVDSPGKEWFRKGSELEALLAEIGVKADFQTIRNTIINYDMATMREQEYDDVEKRFHPGIVGIADFKPDGTYDPDSYSFDDADLCIRLIAPSTHYTMGGLKVDLDRRVLDANSQPIPGLYAAGEVTGGFFGGNRLGGNALTEVMASGRIAARGVQKYYSSH